MGWLTLMIKQVAERKRRLVRIIGSLILGAACYYLIAISTALPTGCTGQFAADLDEQLAVDVEPADNGRVHL